ncbi:hypothetical protein CEXT_426941 [Caerostris extrusa]|uniref:Ribosomal protein L5 n=1 Tax=Caerostris extrusa TaxID=172846 RepID=A0AAV4QGY6_CAEEX|nr:hypothetical protein CEXT_426941 [Caerostris extrusa]
MHSKRAKAWNHTALSLLEFLLRAQTQLIRKSTRYPYLDPQTSKLMKLGSKMTSYSEQKGSVFISGMINLAIEMSSIGFKKKMRMQIATRISPIRVFIQICNGLVDENGLKNFVTTLNINKTLPHALDPPVELDRNELKLEVIFLARGEEHPSEKNK